MLTLRPLPPRPDDPPGFAEPSYRPFERPADASTWCEKPEGAERPYGRVARLIPAHPDEAAAAGDREGTPRSVDGVGDVHPLGSQLLEFTLKG